MESLKTCPFCGGAGEVIAANSGFYAACTDDGCHVMIGYTSSHDDSWGAFETSEEAAAAWNSREPRETTMVQIFQRVAVDNGITVQDLRSATRLRHVAWPRQYGMLLCRRNGLTYEQIGRYLHRDYTTVMHGVQAALKRESKK